MHIAIGIVCFALIVMSAWILGRDSMRAGDRNRMIAIAGSLLIAPWAIIALLWIGVATPWDATPSENVMRYEVLAVASIAVTIGFVFLYRVLSTSGEILFSTFAVSFALLAGAAYLTWTCFQTGVWLIRANRESVTPAIADMNIILDVQLFFAGAMTYVAAAAGVASMVRTKLLSWRAGAVYVGLSALALTLLVMRGVTFPNPNASSTPWYETPGFIVGIPAMPWLIPFLMGVILLYRTPESSDNRRDK